MPFQQRREVTCGVYRAALQWPMYGANARRTQAHTDIGLRPPFRVVWSRGVGSLIEFPAVVSDGVAFIGNFKGTIYALDMRDGKRGLALRPARREDGLLARGRRREHRRARDGRRRPRARPAQRPAALAATASAPRSSPRRSSRGGVDYFGAWNGRVYALDLKRRKLRWSYRDRGARSPPVPRLAAATLYIGDYGGRLLALSASTGQRSLRRAP